MSDPFIAAPLVAVPLGLALAYLLVRYLRGRAAGWEPDRGPLPDEWWPVALTHVPVLQHLDPVERDRLLRCMRAFVGAKSFEGCDGLAVTEAMKVVIAAQACLLILHLGGPVYPGVQAILLYPGAFVAKRAGWVRHATAEASAPLAGEAHQGGEVVLAWDQVVTGGADPADGQNVVYHEFAHQLDLEDHAADGVPLLEQPLTYRGWRRILGASYDHLRERLGRHLDAGALREYGATDLAEFFAVATEAFFERPVALAAEYPELFDLLVRYYRQDPRRWFGVAPPKPGRAALREAFGPVPWGRLFLRSLVRWQVLALLGAAVVLQIAVLRGERSLRTVWRADCRARYAAAHGRADSVVVDRHVNGGGDQMVTCRELRLVKDSGAAP